MHRAITNLAVRGHSLPARWLSSHLTLPGVKSKTASWPAIDFAVDRLKGSALPAKEAEGLVRRAAAAARGRHHWKLGIAPGRWGWPAQVRPRTCGRFSFRHLSQESVTSSE